jgi:hypothetical protein
MRGKKKEKEEKQGEERTVSQGKDLQETIATLELIFAKSKFLVVVDEEDQEQDGNTHRNHKNDGIEERDKLLVSIRITRDGRERRDELEAIDIDTIKEFDRCLTEDVVGKETHCKQSSGKSVRDKLGMRTVRNTRGTFFFSGWTTRLNADRKHC